MVCILDSCMILVVDKSEQDQLKDILININYRGALRNYWMQVHLCTDRSNENGTLTNKPYWNEGTLNGDKIH